MSKNKQQNEFYPVALTIAGSDSGGGAGIQADLRTFNAFGVYGCTAITAVTAQNPRRVARIDPIPADGVRAQIETVLDGIRVRTAKSGMPFNSGIVECVAACVRKARLVLVADPVMVSTSGARLLEEEAVAAVRELLIPEAAWITPNLPEMELLLGRRLRSDADCREAAARCGEKWGVNVLLKSGHATCQGGFATDFVWKSGQLYALTSPRLPDSGASHGTGCTLSAALAAAAALGGPWEQALRGGEAVVYRSPQEGVVVGESLPAMYPPVEDSLKLISLEKL